MGHNPEGVEERVPFGPRATSLKAHLAVLEAKFGRLGQDAEEFQPAAVPRMKSECPDGDGDQTNPGPPSQRLRAPRRTGAYYIKMIVTVLPVMKRCRELAFGICVHGHFFLSYETLERNSTM